MMSYFNKCLLIIFILTYLLTLIECNNNNNKKKSPVENTPKVKQPSTNITPGVPIAIIYDKSTSIEVQSTVDRAIRNINNGIKYGRVKWAVQTSVIDVSDSHELVQTICQQMSRGVLAIFGPTRWTSINTLASFTDFYNVPYISWSYLERKKRIKKQIKRNLGCRNKNFEENAIFRLSRNVEALDDYNNQVDYENNDIQTEISDFSNFTNDEDQTSQIYLRPDLSQAIIELIKFYEWSTIYYVYNYDHAILNLESLIDYQNNDVEFAEKILVRRVNEIHNCRDMLRAIEASYEEGPRNNKIVMIIDLDSKESYKYFLNQIKDLGMTKTKYYYILSTIGVNELDINEFRHGGANLIGFSIVDYHNINTIKLLSDMLQSGEAFNKIPNIPHSAALLIDGLAFFSKRVNSVIGLNMSRLFGLDNVSLRRAEIYVNKSKGINCSYSFEDQPKWPLGKYVLDQLKDDKDDNYYTGLTGPISFDAYGRRKNYTIGIYKVELNLPLTKIGHYSSEKGLNIKEEKAKGDLDESGQIKQRKLIVISIIDEPFFMLKANSENFTGNDRFEGYCVDLTKRLAEMVNFTYELRLVKDRNFGARDANGNWNGLVGELVRHEADIAVAPLTISSQRERAIEFSMPFMNVGISIMIKKPKKEKPGVFSFMAPLDSKIWVCVILAFIGVSAILYLVSKFSPYEWHYDSKKNDHALHNDFTILNTLWFNLAAVMQQGVDIAPRCVSGRVVASAWWFFTLILISSYTANLAAFLTVERMVSPIESAEQLSRQTEIQYGAVEGGATKEFFKNSRVDVYMRMWNFMNSWGSGVFVKSNKEGVQKVRDSKGKYAFLLESTLNEYLNERYPCDTIKVGNELDSKGYGVATPIRSELRDPINLAILQLREEGFLDELKTRWWYDRSECGGTTGGSKDSSQSALNLINVAGIFYILIVGLILSVLVATCELMYKARKQSKKNKILFTDAVKSKMRLSLSGYEDSLKDYLNNKNEYSPSE